MTNKVNNADTKKLGKIQMIVGIVTLVVLAIFLIFAFAYDNTSKELSFSMGGNEYKIDAERRYEIRTYGDSDDDDPKIVLTALSGDDSMDITIERDENYDLGTGTSMGEFITEDLEMLKQYHRDVTVVEEEEFENGFGAILKDEKGEYFMYVVKVGDDSIRCESEYYDMPTTNDLIESCKSIRK